jgi:glutathione S-transferase
MPRTPSPVRLRSFRAVWIRFSSSGVSFRAMKEPAHLALHPFGQIPTYEEGDLALFETVVTSCS